jgi:hypothetical protein
MQNSSTIKQIEKILIIKLAMFIEQLSSSENFETKLRDSSDFSDYEKHILFFQKNVILDSFKRYRLNSY